MIQFQLNRIIIAILTWNKSNFTLFWKSFRTFQFSDGTVKVRNETFQSSEWHSNEMFGRWIQPVAYQFVCLRVHLNTGTDAIQRWDGQFITCFILLCNNNFFFGMSTRLVFFSSSCLFNQMWIISCMSGIHRVNRKSNGKVKAIIWLKTRKSHQINSPAFVMNLRLG